MAAPQPYRLAPPSGWIVPVADAPLTEARVEGSGDYDFLLVDQQVRLGKVTEQYFRYVERMVNQSSVDRSAQVSLEIDPRHEKLLVHEVRVFRNGRAIDKLADARRSLLNRESNLDNGLIDGRVTLHLLLQDVRVGDVLDYSYTVERTDPFGERGYNSWFMTRWAVPVRHYRLRVQHPTDRALQILDESKLPKPTVDRHGAWTETAWDANDIARFARRGFATVLADFLPAHRAQRIHRLGRCACLVAAAVRGAATEGRRSAGADRRPSRPNPTSRPDCGVRCASCRTTSVTRALKSARVRIGRLNPAAVLARRFGDCKDKVLLLVTILRALGVEAYPALVNSRWARALPVARRGRGHSIT